MSCSSELYRERGRDMRQTILSVVLEVEPKSARHLAGLIEDFRRFQENKDHPDQESYSRLKDGVPSLHFLSMSIFRGADYDPLFVIEANFDGLPGAFWAQMETTLANNLRPMLRCCKRPLGGDGPTYDAVTQAGSRQPLTPYLKKRTQKPSVFHQGNRGLERDRILQERELFLATREILNQSSPTAPNPFRGIPAEQIHRDLRAALMGRFPWLATAAPERISRAERVMDIARLAGLAFLALLVLSLPGIVAALLLSDRHFFILVAALLVVTVIFPLWTHAPREGEGVPTRSGGLSPDILSVKNVVVVLAALAAYVVVASAIGALIPWLHGASCADALRSTAHVVVLGLIAALLVVLPAVVAWLRWLERGDSSQDAPPVDQRLLSEMVRREDRIPQNHMGSVVLVKPGVLRMALFRAGHKALGLFLRVVATDGYLGSMRTVHFAHWAFVNNSSRLMFFSNFDHSWESYLDDFIEKAHAGLTLAWGSGVGFPPTRFLILDGASHGRKFKAWARHSMAVNRVWFSAYKDLTVDQIERHVRIADGLRKATLTPQEAVAWAQDL